jgi:hypothetical protein
VQARRKPGSEPAPDAVQVVTSWRHTMVRCLVIAIPATLVTFWEVTGASLALAASTAGVLLLLGERRKLVLILLPLVLAFTLVYLFRTYLYLRLPGGLLDLG